ncbi:putative lecithin:cholesterol acyltransferase lcat [Cotesia congregata filamentous virus 1]|uniref:Lecithin:cholesterol acyltransferase lcat n=1 Tax=Cotesia congregata filamentous virus 1 TaxID=3064291 RepID=A0ABC8QJX4_9VIRU|nr:putative lecithin:cholesterol acyltransferase lcat [Cotesia congregata filamentous virus 1]
MSENKILFIFVPGMFGSVLCKRKNNKVVYPPTVKQQLFPSYRRRVYEKYILNPRAQLVPRGILKTYCFSDIYKTFLDSIKQQVPGVRVLEFSYDWRKWIPVLIEELHNYLAFYTETEKNKNIPIVLCGHSLGGFLIRLLLEQHPRARNFNYIDRVKAAIFCGTPFFGKHNLARLINACLQEKKIPSDMNALATMFDDNPVVRNFEAAKLLTVFYKSILPLIRLEDLTHYLTPDDVGGEREFYELYDFLVKNNTINRYSQNIKYIFVNNAGYTMSPGDGCLPRIFGTDGIIGYTDADLVKINSLFNSVRVCGRLKVSHARLLTDTTVINKIIGELLELRFDKVVL